MSDDQTAEEVPDSPVGPQEGEGERQQMAGDMEVPGDREAPALEEEEGEEGADEEEHPARFRPGRRDGRSPRGDD